MTDKEQLPRFRLAVKVVLDEVELCMVHHHREILTVKEMATFGEAFEAFKALVSMIEGLE